VTADAIARGIAEGAVIAVALVPALRLALRELVRREFQTLAATLPCAGRGTPPRTTPGVSEDLCRS
jgi:hypothetical protein